jgi:hypothetical protein
VPPQVRKTEADKWREQAHNALAQFAKAMEFFMYSSAQLVRLTEVHAPDDFNHCLCCKEPWPCTTMEIVQSIGARFTQLQEETHE